MVCYHPLKAWDSCDGETMGKVVFNRLPGSLYISVPLPCGKCIGCRMESARQWAIRCMHEAEMHDDNCMVTLTYNDENMPDDGSLQPVETQLWLKRLRKKFPERRIKFFLAGEYGDQHGRPHYHALLFGIDFCSKINYNKYDTRPSKSLLEETWDKGFIHVAPLTFETAAYVARYCLKKQEKENDYVNKSNGVILVREFVRMSRRPGIGKTWLEKNHVDTYSDDTIVIAGNRKTRPPRYYDKTYIKNFGEKSLEEIKIKRLKESFDRRKNTTEERLLAREKVAIAKRKMLKRSYENA